MPQQASGAPRHPRWQVWRLLLSRRELHRGSGQWSEPMEERVQSAGEPESGGTEVISDSFSSFDTALAADVLCENPIPAIEKGLRRKRIGAWNRFPQRKNLANTIDVQALGRCRNGGENGRENRATVTTYHVFWPNQQGKPPRCYRSGYGIPIFRP
jgi:hypothetical protein